MEEEEEKESWLGLVLGGQERAENQMLNINKG